MRPPGTAAIGSAAVVAFQAYHAGRLVRACQVCGCSCYTEPYSLVQMVPKWPLPFAPVVSCCMMSCADSFFHREDVGANGGTIRHLGTPWVLTNSGVKMH